MKNTILNSKLGKAGQYQLKPAGQLIVHLLNCSFKPYLRAKFVTKWSKKEKKSTGLYWLLFLISTAALIFAIAVHFEYLTLILPFQVTFFAKALDIM